MRKKLIFGTAIALIAISANSLIHASNRETTSADTLPPIVQQVNDHEERIGTLEETTEEIQQEVAETKTQVNQTKDRTSALENSASANQQPAQQPIETPKLREGEITHVKHEVYPPGRMNGEFVASCVYQINTVTRYKSTSHGLLPGQSCLKVGDLISSLE